MSAKTEYDIVISGGGVVGCLAAIALSQDTQLSVGLLEAGSAENPNAMGLDLSLIHI